MENDLNEVESQESEAETQERELAEQKSKANTFLGWIKDREHAFDTGWWKSAKDSVKLYSMDAAPGEGAGSAYNILYSNTEVLLPSLYSAQAKPDIRSRFKGVDIKPIPEAIERFLTIATDGTQPGFESFDDAVKDATLSALTAGAGCIRIRLLEDQEFPIQFESVPFTDVIWGKAKKWAKVPWLAFRYELTKEALFKQMGLDITDEELSAKYSLGDAAEGKESNTCVLYEFWHRASREVWFISEEWMDVVLKVIPDPLEIKGFFPTPNLLQLTLKPASLEPTPLYKYYQNQAEELNRVTVRLNKVLSAIRVRGVYNSLLGDDMAKLLNDGEMENGLFPASEAGLLAQTGGFEKQIWLLPIEQLITVAKELYSAREAIKQVIYELTGISDIIRGSSVASETATAQDLKNKWGTVRLRKMQTAVANYVRDLFRIAVDVGAAKVAPETWQKLTQLGIPLEREKQIAQQQLQYLQMQAAPGPQIPGMPAPPPPAPPDPKLLQAAQSPSMEEILQRISSDIDRTFTVNIQTSSTIDLDTAADKGEVSEFMNAMAQLLSGLQPLAALGPSGLAAAKEILVAVCQRYKFGISIAEAISQIQPPPPAQPEHKGPPPPSPEEIAADKAEHSMRMQKAQFDAQEAKAAHENNMLKIQTERAKLQQELELIPLRIAAERAKLLATRSQKAQNAPVPSQM